MQDILVMAIAGAIMALVLGLIIAAMDRSRRSSAARDFARALASPNATRQLRKARFKPDENLAAIGQVPGPREKEVLSPEVVLAIQCVAPDLEPLFRPHVGDPIHKALSAVVAELDARINRAKVQRELDIFTQVLALRAKRVLTQEVLLEIQRLAPNLEPRFRAHVGQPLERAFLAVQAELADTADATAEPGVRR